jgi:hypothetical protein
MTIAEQGKDIPRAPAYVTMTDTFMSGWGHAKNKTNRHIIVCQSFGEACEIARLAEARPEMKRINITTNRPRLRAGRVTTYSPAAGWLSQ